MRLPKENWAETLIWSYLSQIINYYIRISHLPPSLTCHQKRLANLEQDISAQIWSQFSFWNYICLLILLMLTNLMCIITCTTRYKICVASFINHYLLCMRVSLNWTQPQANYHPHGRNKLYFNLLSSFLYTAMHKLLWHWANLFLFLLIPFPEIFRWYLLRVEESHYWPRCCYETHYDKCPFIANWFKSQLSVESK